MTSPDTDPRPLSCDEMVELVTAYLEGALGPDDTVSFEAHLGLCPGCRIYLDQFRETIRSASTLAASEVPPAVMADLLACFRGWRGRRGVS